MFQPTNPRARIALRGDFPQELIGLLSSLQLDPFGVGGLDADIVAALARQRDGGWMLEVRSSPRASGTESATLCTNAYVAASLLLSHTLRLDTPVIVASEPTYAVLHKAIELAATPANVLIEGETGTGKRSLAELIDRASGNPYGLICIDCAVAAEVARFIGASRSGRDGSRTRVVLLDHLAKVPREAQETLAAHLRHRKWRFLATSRLSIKQMVAKGAFVPALLDQFDATLELSPLNRHRIDREVLAQHFLLRANPSLKLDPTALTALRHYRFAGNIRELRNMMIGVAIGVSDDSAPKSTGRRSRITWLVPLCRRVRSPVLRKSRMMTRVLSSA